jgi:hypothetical protein
MLHKATSCVVAAMLAITISASADTLKLTFSDGKTGTCTVDSGVVKLVTDGIAADCTEASIAFLPTTNPNPTDTDEDGVPDTADKCPGTPVEIAVETEDVASAGCSDAQKSVDADDDNVPDYMDKCPNTAKPTPPALVEGCALIEEPPKWGETASGVAVSKAEERSGAITDTVYVPNQESPQLVIYEGIINDESIYPGCGDKYSMPKDQWASCGSRSSLEGGVVYAVRLRPSTGWTRVEFRTNTVGDQLFSYNVAVRNEPSVTPFTGLSSALSPCGALATNGITVSTSKCDTFDASQLSYALFSPANNRFNIKNTAAKCGTASLTCRLLLYPTK